MGFYGHFYDNNESITPIGKKIVARENGYYCSLLNNLFLKEKIKVFEIGVGKGDFAKACRRSGNYEYTGIEANFDQALKLRQAGFNVQADRVPPINRANETFDVVFANQVIEHMSTLDKVVEFITDIRRVLKPGGVVFIGAPDYFMYREGFFDNDYTHNYVTTVSRISQLLEDHDFKVIHRDYMTLSLHGRFITYVISLITRFAFWTRLPYLCFSTKRAHNIRYSMLRGFFIIGKKVHDPRPSL